MAMLSKGGAAHARGAAGDGGRQRSRPEVGWSGVSPPRAVSRSVIYTRHTYGRNERSLCAFLRPPGFEPETFGLVCHNKTNRAIRRCRCPGKCHV